ncbi:MAG: response regulator [Desulfatiglandales bacterium]
MSAYEILKGKKILVVDDEPDVLATVEEILDMCEVEKALDFDSALELINKKRFHIVILDIQGVNGFELLKHSVARGYPTVMLTAHVATPDALKESINLGAEGFLPKEYMAELPEILSEILLGKGQRLWWQKSMKKTDEYFERKYGSDWKEKDTFFKEFIKSLEAR